MARKYKLPFHWVESLGLKTYRYGIALSEQIRSELLKCNPRLQVIVIPNGVAPELIDRHVDSNGGGHILFLGRIDIEQKGLDLLLNAIQQAKDGGLPPVQIAGSGIAREEARLQHMIAKAELKHRIKWLGKISGEEKNTAFQKAVFLVMPSRFEGFPLALLEAFCWKLPVILFSIPELAALPESCCMKIKPFDVDAFSKAMVRLAHDIRLREQMGCAAKKWVQAFSWDALADQYENFFAKIMNARQT
jgi:glycosyltransferase involved in cell wall biosynthesis